MFLGSFIAATLYLTINLTPFINLYYIRKLNDTKLIAAFSLGCSTTNLLNYSIIGT